MLFAILVIAGWAIGICGIEGKLTRLGIPPILSMIYWGTIALLLFFAEESKRVAIGVEMKQFSDYIANGLYGSGAPDLGAGLSALLIIILFWIGIVREIAGV